LAVAACTTHAVPARVETRDFASGTRLKAHVWDVGGALVLRDFFDTALGASCAFTENGVFHLGPGPAYYCMPLIAARHDPGAGPFADDKCTVPLGISPLGEPAAYVVIAPVDACQGAPVVHRAGARKTSFPYTLDGGACTNALSALTTQEIGDVVPLETFARANEHPDDATRGIAGRVGALVAESSDGAHFTVGGYDRVRREVVRADGPANGPLRWVPARVAFVGAGQTTYGDAACSEAVATKAAHDAACPLSAALVFTGNCADTTTFHALGAPVEGGRLHARDEAGACGPEEAAGTLAFEVAEAIDPSAFAAAPVLQVGGPSVFRRGFAGPDGGDAIAWSDVVDGTTGEACTPTAAADGVTRCLPSASAGIDLFADEGCTTPAYAEPLTGCERDAGPRFVRQDDPAGGRAFEVTGEAPTLYQRTDRCARFTPVVPSRGRAVREVDVKRFAVAEDRILP
jgi:hypothetical protein